MRENTDVNGARKRAVKAARRGMLRGVFPLVSFFLRNLLVGFSYAEGAGMMAPARVDVGGTG